MKYLYIMLLSVFVGEDTVVESDQVSCSAEPAPPANPLPESR